MFYDRSKYLQPRASLVRAFSSILLLGVLLSNPALASGPSAPRPAKPSNSPCTMVCRWLATFTTPDRSRLATEMLRGPQKLSGDWIHDSVMDKFERTQWLPLNNALNAFAAGQRANGSRADDAVVRIAANAYKSRKYRNLLAGAQLSPLNLMYFMHHVHTGPASQIVQTDQQSAYEIRVTKVHQQVFNDLASFYDALPNAEPIMTATKAVFAEQKTGFFGLARHNKALSRLFSIQPTDYMKYLSAPLR